VREFARLSVYATEVVMAFAPGRRFVGLGLFVILVMSVGTAEAQKLAAGQNHTLVVKAGWLGVGG
jgi:hypothetical protein